MTQTEVICSLCSIAVSKIKESRLIKKKCLNGERDGMNRGGEDKKANPHRLRVLVWRTIRDDFSRARADRGIELEIARSHTS